MIRIDHGSSRPVDEPGIVPMINIIFLLLIFFMIAGEMDHIGMLEAPVSKSLNVPDEAFIEIVIDVNGNVTVDGVKPLVGLADYLQSLAPEDGAFIICRVHRDLPGAVLDPVITATRGLTGVRLQIITRVI